MTTHFGKYRAFVRENTDPERLGRVRLEIPAVLGTGPDNWSEWASPCFPFGGNDDSGMFMVPDVGASVWAEFEGGDAQYPIWVGVWLAKTDPGEQPVESCRLCSEATCQDCEDAASASKEHTKWHGHPDYYCPRVRVLMKSETGHTILADDKDGSERLALIDRGGAGLQFRCPVKPEDQVGNILRRGERDAREDTGIPLDHIDDEAGAEVLLTDVCGQRLLMVAQKDKERVVILSRNQDGTREQKIEIDSTLGHEMIRLYGLNSGQEIVIDGTLGAERIQMRDAAGSVVILDGRGGNVVVRPRNMMLVERLPQEE